MSQRWACALEPNWFRRTSPSGVGSSYQRRIVYCDTSRYRYATAEKPRGRCLVFRKYASWKLCSDCDLKHSMGGMGSSLLPSVIPEACATKQFQFDRSDSRCRHCFQKRACVHEQVQNARKVRLVVVK